MKKELRLIKSKNKFIHYKIRFVLMSFCIAIQLFTCLSNAATLQGGVSFNDELEVYNPSPNNISTTSPNLLTLAAEKDKTQTNDQISTKIPKQDCICFNRDNIEIKEIQGRYKLVDNRNVWVLDFSNNLDYAKQSLAVIQQYKLNNICFVGRPFVGDQVKMMYFLSDGQAPQGQMTGEDAIPFNPLLLKAEQIKGSWKVTEGNHWMMDFANNKNDAETAVDIIKYYGFTQECFIGRPGPPMMYFRK